MKEVIQFIVRDAVVEEIDATDVTINEVEGIKCSLAIIHTVNYHEIEVNKTTKSENEPAKSDSVFICSNGLLMLRPAPNAFFKAITGISPDKDINHEEILNEWLDMIVKKDVDNCLIFR